MIVLDGSYGEAGGQIVRTAIALSAITGQSFEVADIRKGRPSPGLKAQHVYSAKIMQAICSADAEGLEAGSEYLLFIPGRINTKSMNFDIGTAGSIPLVLQSVLLPLAFANKKTRLMLIGGTDVKWSMSIDYFREVILPPFRRLAGVDLKVICRGYYPVGGGSIELSISPKISLSQFPDFSSFHEELRKIGRISLLSQGRLAKINGVSHASASLQKGKVAERQANAASLALKKFGCPVAIRTEYANAKCDGSGITLWAYFTNAHGEIDATNPVILGADALGEQGKSSEAVGEEAASRLAAEIESGACVDSYMCDNLIPLLGLIGGEIKTSGITEHTKTNIYVAEKFLKAKFYVDEENKVIKSEF